MNWQVKMALAAYKKRLAEAQRDYDVHEALYADRRGSNSNISPRILTLTARLLVDLGKRLQRWGCTPTDAPQAETR